MNAEMERVRGRIRPTDVVLTVALTALGVLLMWGNMTGQDGTRVDSTTWLIVPVFLLAMIPVLFRRIDTVAVILVSMAAMAVHVVAFGWMVRCGAGLPLAFVLAYSAGRLLPERGKSVVGLLLTIALQALVLVRDSAAGLEIIPFTAGIGAVAWGVGWFVRTRIADRDASRDTSGSEPALAGTRA